MHGRNKNLARQLEQLRREKVLSKVKGGAYSIELKYKEGGWHVHLHAIIDAPYVPYQRVFSAWRRLNNVDHVEVDIREAKSNEQRRYIAKYVAKNEAFEGTEKAIVEWYNATKGIRLFEVFGSFRAAAVQLRQTEREERDKHALCPNCKQQGTMCYARDGPFIYGEDWLTIQTTILDEDGDERPIKEIAAMMSEEDSNKAKDKSTNTKGDKPEKKEMETEEAYSAKSASYFC